MKCEGKKVSLLVAPVDAREMTEKLNWEDNIFSRQAMYEVLIPVNKLYHSPLTFLTLIPPYYVRKETEVVCFMAQQSAGINRPEEYQATEKNKHTYTISVVYIKRVYKVYRTDGG